METMYAAEGCGLAGTQVGIHKRVIVLDLSYKDSSFLPMKMANPEILWKSTTTCRYEEGCLSVPGQSAFIERAEHVHVRYLDENNHLQEIKAEEFLAVCLQHEIDHLDGKIYIDYLSPLKRQLLIQKAQKVAREQKSKEQ